MATLEEYIELIHYMNKINTETDTTQVDILAHKAIEMLINGRVSSISDRILCEFHVKLGNHYVLHKEDYAQASNHYEIACNACKHEFDRLLAYPIHRNGNTVH